MFFVMVGLTEQRMAVKLYLLLYKHFAETGVMLKIHTLQEQSRISLSF